MNEIYNYEEKKEKKKNSTTAAAYKVNGLIGWSNSSVSLNSPKKHKAHSKHKLPAESGRAHLLTKTETGVLYCPILDPRFQEK